MEQHTSSTQSKKSRFDFQIAGFPWQFILVGAVIALSFLAMVLKVFGVL